MNVPLGVLYTKRTSDERTSRPVAGFKVILFVHSISLHMLSQVVPQGVSDWINHTHLRNKDPWKNRLLCATMLYLINMYVHFNSENKVNGTKPLQRL